MSDSLQFDKRHIWHPYTGMPGDYDLYPVESASGVYLTLTDGRRLIDGMSSWWSVIHGYNHPRLNQAAQQQIERVSHVMFGGLTHQPAIDLAERLLAITPDGLDLVFFSDSGSVSVEVAMKMAVQYWQAQGKADKSRFMALRGGYHGDTFAAMSVCDPVNGMHHLFQQALPQQFFCNRPQTRFGQDWHPDEMADAEKILAEHHQQIAAVILEPIVQGAGGMWFYHPQYLAEMRKLCDQYQVLLIADEIATGFGRSGKLFACEHADIVPDILCIGKALTGGYLSLAATLTSNKIGETISSGESGCFMHGPTFMGNPLACNIAAASIDVLLESDWQSNLQGLEKALIKGLTGYQHLPGVADVRVLGAIGVVEMQNPVDVQAVQRSLIQRGVWLRPFGRLIYTMPSYICSDQEIAELCEAIKYTVLENAT